MRFRLTVPIAATLLAAVLFDHVAQAATYTVGAAADTEVTVHPGLGGTSGVNGSDATMYAIGTGGFESHPLVRFDLSSFAGAGHSVFGSASVRLFLNGGQSIASNNSMNLNRVLVNWDETTSWDTFGPQPGYNAGTDFDSAPVAAQAVTSAAFVSYVSFPIPASLVQEWIDTPATNFGLFMHVAGAPSGNDLRFSSREGANSPQLVFDSYTSAFVINEVVGDPQQDWSHSSGGVPFDGTPGIGVVNSSDEYIELKNISPFTQSLEGYQLYMDDGSDATDCFGFAGVNCTTAATYRVAPSGSLLAVPPGGYVVIGNPSGDILNVVSMSLSDSTNGYEHMVTFGVDAPDLNSNSITDEAVSLTPDGGDSHTGPFFFSHGTASLGSANPPGGDYNHDGTVDAADYVVWRKTDGTQAGYDTWRSHFGQPAGNGTGANTTVPEPAPALLLIMAVAGVSTRRRRCASLVSKLINA